VKAITINKLGNVADFHFTRAKYRQRTLNVRGSLKLVQGDNLKQLQERYIGKKIRATGRLVNKNGVFIVILLKKDTFHLVGANLTE